MAKNRAFELEALDGQSCGLSVRFDSAGDNFQQSIDAISDGIASPLLVATSTPPFQEIVRSTHKDSPYSTAEWPALLITGAGEKKYWSATAIAVTDMRLALLSFDFASRIGNGAMPPSLTFGVADGVSVEQTVSEDEDDSISLRSIHGRPYYLTAGYRRFSDDSEVESQPTCRLSVNRSQITICPIGGPHFMNGPTVRWSFEIQLRHNA